MGVKSFCLHLFQLGINAAFTTVLVPKQCFINNRNLSILQKFLYACVAGGIAWLLLNAPSQYLLITIPTGFPRIGASISNQSTFDTAVTSEISSGVHCASGTRDQYAFHTNAANTDGEHWASATCINPKFFYDGDADVGVGRLFLPTAFNENRQHRAEGGAEFTALQLTCAATFGPPSAYANGMPGYTGWVDLDTGNAGTKGLCKQNPSTYLVAGVTKKTVSFDHLMVVENSSTGKTEFAYSNSEDAANKARAAPPLMTVVQMYDQTQEKWVEGSCASSPTTQEAEQCRFQNGQSVSMSVEDWLKNAGIADLNSENMHSGMGTNAQYDAGDAEKGKLNATWRTSGLELILQLEYLDSAFHGNKDWKDPATGTLKSFPGVIAFAKVQLNPLRTTQIKKDYLPLPGQTVALTAIEGSVRRRVTSGIAITTVTSANSKRGFLSYLALIQYLAVSIVYFNFCTLACMYLALYTLGNTSRNYARVIREQVNVAVQSARRTPAKLMIAACTFFLMREWEHDKEAMHKFMDDHTVVHRTTIDKFMMTCYNPDLLPEIEEDEVEDMVNATWNEMAGANDSGISLIEFVESALSSEAVDYISTRAAFNKQRKKTPLEKIFGDNVSSYAEKDKKMCYGLVPNPSSLKDAKERKIRNKLRANLAAKIPGLNAGLDGAGALLGVGAGLGKLAGNIGLDGAGALMGGLGKGANLMGGAVGLGDTTSKMTGAIGGGMGAVSGGMRGMLGGKKKNDKVAPGADIVDTKSAESTASAATSTSSK